MQPLHKINGLIKYWTCIIYFILKFNFFEFYYLSYIYPRVIGKKNADFECYNLSIYQFQ
jgi:hypothetical protein